MGTFSGYTCALLLALACIRGSSAKLNMNHLCALVNDGLMISSYDACDAYYVCQGGVASRKSCMSGQYFSKDTQNCMPQDQVQCFAANAPPCSGYSIGTWAPVTGSCTDFYYCSPNGPERSSCPMGQYFNPNQQDCVYPSQYDCVETTADDSSSETTGSSSSISITISLPLNLCHFVKNNLFFGNPSSCSGWHKCLNDVMISGVCPNGLMYNVVTMACEYKSDVTCSQVTNDPYLMPNNCSTVNAKKAGITCDTYFVCDGSYYQVAQCPSGEYYDTVSQTCVNRLEARNNCDRCLGTTSSFVNMYSASNCTGYLYCVNGVETSSGYCPSGSYFDERAGACLEGSTDPLLGCCNPAYYNATSSESTTDSSVVSTTVSNVNSTNVANTTLSTEESTTLSSVNSTNVANTTLSTEESTTLSSVNSTNVANTTLSTEESTTLSSVNSTNVANTTL